MLVYVLLGLVAVEVGLPSPKSHVGVGAGRAVAERTAWPEFTVAGAVKSAVTTAQTWTSCSTKLVPPPLTTVSRTLKVPARGNVCDGELPVLLAVPSPHAHVTESNGPPCDVWVNAIRVPVMCGSGGTANAAVGAGTVTRMVCAGEVSCPPPLTTCSVTR
jgi:hypothetical protein